MRSAVRRRGPSGRSGGTGDPGPRTNCTRFETNIVAAALGVQRTPRPPLAELTRVGSIDDYDAPIRDGSTVADLDGNLWVLPRTTTLSKKGELVYDVINAKGELFERVRLPLGRAIAGFAKGGVVYLTSGDMANGFHLERTRLTPIGVIERSRTQSRSLSPMPGIVSMRSFVSHTAILALIGIAMHAPR